MCSHDEESDGTGRGRDADGLDRKTARAEKIDERQHGAAESERHEGQHRDEGKPPGRRARLVGHAGPELDRQVGQLADREQQGADDCRPAVEGRLVDHEDERVGGAEQS